MSATRSVSQWERALLARWFAGTDRRGTYAIVAAYVSERSHDDPRLRNMIVIAEHAKNDISYLVHRPSGENAWVVTCGRTGSELGRFRTLPEALHMIRPGQRTDGVSNFTEPLRSEDQLAQVSSGR